jgi:dihydroorotate dehydrogenase electron transfer subunit
MNNRSQAYQVFRITRVMIESHTTRRLVFDGSLGNARPGQYVMVWLPGIGEKPYSICENDPLSVVVSDVGPFSHQLALITAGQRIWIRGPFGNSFSLYGKKNILAAGGYGAAPLLFLAQQARQNGTDVIVCLGARSSADLLLQDDFSHLGCEVVTATNDGSQGMHGLVTSAVNAVIDRFSADCLYACGPVPMITAISEISSQNKLHSQFSLETNLRCGMGLCGSCEMDVESRNSIGLPPGWLVCSDGPVFIK